MYYTMTLLNRLQVRLNAISLKAKVIIGVSLILIVVIGLFTYYDTLARIKFHFDKQEEWAFELSDTVMRSIEYPMFDGNMDYVQAILERLYKMEDVKVVNLCDANGVIKYSGLPSNIGKKDTSEITKKALLTGLLTKGLEILGGERVLYHAMPIANEKTCYKCHGRERRILGVLTVGINWTPIEERVIALRNREIFLGIISIIVVGFFLTLFLTKYVTRPLSTLTRLADEISRGNPGFEFGRVVKCWEIQKCDEVNCPAYGNTEIMCWYIDDTLCKAEPSGKFPEKLNMCRKCTVYKRHMGDEMVQLADAFKHMLYRLRISKEKLKQSEEKYKFLFDTDPNSIFILDHETYRILDANARAESQYGYSKEEFLNMSFWDLGFKEDMEEMKYHFKNILDGRCVLFSKKSHRKKDGSRFYVNIHVCGVRFAGKNAFIATTIDITESVQKEAQLIQTSKLATLGEMAAGIAHELNQPLNVMKVGSDFLKKMIERGKKISDKDLKTVAQQISSQVDRASQIINHLREFARVSDIEAHEVNINEPIRNVFKILGQQLRLRQIEVELDLDENLPPIMADSNRLEQVFINLVTNARDAIEEKPSGDKLLKIKSFLDKNDVVVTVSDSGKGIPRNIMDRIFEPFFTTKEIGKGTGLGLSISYAIIRDYGGSITVESEEGVGTTFELRFPACFKHNKNTRH
ncbi:MAG TPA: PAS domain S-box protein [Candidatus Desulfofervidus auxilii]|uniref:histidine kinase n=1 Tax=Desulfofervidus auxilii TaxID=1621989 RepID=A0A7C0Y5U0_DESA2|nr:PAS domain S-box protein [Candidatus Desulfofervidus auxilii]